MASNKPTDNPVLPDDVIDIEEYAKSGATPPKGRRYRIRVNKKHIVFDISNPTREQILTEAGLTPTDNWTLRLKINGGHRLIEEGEQVDLTKPGIEKFKALPRDQTEG